MFGYDGIEIEVPVTTLNGWISSALDRDVATLDEKTFKLAEIVKKDPTIASQIVEALASGNFMTYANVAGAGLKSEELAEVAKLGQRIKELRTRIKQLMNYREGLKWAQNKNIVLSLAVISDLAPAYDKTVEYHTPEDN